ncbi:MAG: phosphoadenosine phosphosulfate reductase [Rhodobacterales bacterium]|nr:phosphoadenosine phosphosulfate reductase [Rhodobacterales bacterium]MDX5390692.1 phosphoadenosine phosphosulfate reductase [Rhodobacterales bacterium]MDX5490393.1 phosphoadenosine phosphosulfate reductase [Rhodobacterales bacterium]
MPDTEILPNRSLSGLKKREWITQLAAIAEEYGSFEDLGGRHFATRIDGDDTLLVSFETVQGIQLHSDLGQPLGWDMVRDKGWSHLCLISDGDTWFRDPQVYALFDRLTDEGYFEEYERVIFYGAGPCGYAAAAFSVASPGAIVLAVQPQATLDPRVTEWDNRFAHMRRTSFTDRYGYAPDMMDAAHQGYVLYDPAEDLDAMHAALFTRPNVTKLRLRYMGDALQGDLVEMEILAPLLTLAAEGGLTCRAFARLARARREHPAYLRGLLGHLDAQHRPYLALLLCRNVVERMNAPRIRRRLDGLEKSAAAGEFTPPPPARNGNGAAAAQKA